ncbi:MAG TPA: thiamine phosphate synthase [Capsulimonadaceae bacterium]|jgi:thiamine-phosphate pyrophosphorylase
MVLQQLKLTLIVDRILYRPQEDRPPVSLVEEAIAGGVSQVQLRLANSASDDISAFALALKLREITSGKVPFVVTDDLDLAEKCHADGIFLTTALSYRPSAVRDYIRSAHGIVGCYTPSVTTAARAERGGADYVQVGPVFSSEADTADVGLALIRKVKDAVLLPVIAFGGVSSLEQARKAIGAGAAGIAVTDAILAADDPRAAAASYAALL